VRRSSDSKKNRFVPEIRLPVESLCDIINSWVADGSDRDVVGDGYKLLDFRKFYELQLDFCQLTLIGDADFRRHDKYREEGHSRSVFKSIPRSGTGRR
jgi:hypothetical protein